MLPARPGDRRSVHRHAVPRGQVLAGLSAPQAAALELEGGAAAYRAVSRAGCTSIAGVDDRAEYAATCDALHAAGVAPREFDVLLRALAACLHISNLDFEESAAGSTVVAAAAAGALGRAARRLGVEDAALAAALTERVVEAGGCERIRTGLSLAQAQAASAAAAKLIYVRLFDWIIARVRQRTAHCHGFTGWPSAISADAIS